MIDADFTIVAEPDRDFVRITLAGFFRSADVERFRIALLAAYDPLRCGPNQHLTLCDVSGMKIQTQDVVAAFTTVVADPRTRSRRLAFVTGTSLARLQTKRTAARPGVAYFKDTVAAEAWLFAEDWLSEADQACPPSLASSRGSTPSVRNAVVHRSAAGMS